jgi:hypothetical protein
MNLMVLKINIRIRKFDLVKIISFVNQFLSVRLDATYLSVDLFQLNLFPFHMFTSLKQASITKSTSSTKFSSLIEGLHFICQQLIWVVDMVNIVSKQHLTF